MDILTPIFPLQIVVFPGDSLNLHIFEPRYKELVKECFDEKKIFGIPTFFKKSQLKFGTSVKIEKISKRYSDGKMDIKTTGLEVFKINKLIKKIPGKLYSVAEVSYLDQVYNGEITMNQDIIMYIEELYDIMSISKSTAEVSDPQFCFKTAHYLGMNLEQKYELLQIPDEYSRQQFLVEYLKDLIPVAKRIENIRVRAKMNGHFRHFESPDF